jgi:predicted metal-binding protein
VRKQLKAAIGSCGFECQGEFDARVLTVLPEVRAMCAEDRCHEYNKNWSCPPACGTLEQFAELFTHYSCGIAFQTVAQLEDSFDIETMFEAKKLHETRFYDLVRKTGALNADLLLLSAGSCKLCKVCGFPDEACSFPELMRPSMESTGILVNDVCAAASVPYNHGADTISYTSCVLFNEEEPAWDKVVQVCAQ